MSENVSADALLQPWNFRTNSALIGLAYCLSPTPPLDKLPL
jgi:hypothetical protein